jgi:hypothetical protein
MNNGINGHVLANTARMRGDRRRHLRVLLVQIGADLAVLGGTTIQDYRVISAPNQAVAAEAKDLLVASGWKVCNRFPPLLELKSCIALSPPDEECCEPQSFGALACTSPADDCDRGAGTRAGTEDKREHPPNLKALRLLEAIHGRNQDRKSSDSSRTQDYISEARSGGMYEHGDRIDAECSP